MENISNIVIAQSAPRAVSFKTRRRHWFPLALAIPPLIWQLIFFVLPMIFLFTLTFWKVEFYKPVPAFVLDNWMKIIGSSSFQKALIYTFEMSLLSALVVTLIALPAACILAFRVSEKYQPILIALLVVPVFTSYVLRAYAWQVVLSPQGLFNWVLGMLGIDGLNMLGGTFALQVGYLTLCLPVVVLVLTFALLGIDRSHLEAASNLGCRSYQVFWHVLLPSIRNGLLLALTTTFMLAFSDYIAPLLLSGSNPPTLSILIVDTVKSGAQWPRASVIGIIMMLCIGVMLLLSNVVSRKGGGS
ncbi:ABC transporter permease [Neptunomonas sp. CHC150]|uniref:ABC transporter permease n=1 Tax=Neptunomonas sp. CHC150 TaxID=2998324 RepID=UPI0025B003AC|nr:ABC transporter permease [Neptunomonas sp. CHC150]MDN2661156.1 ABC transporter permease [Neptunomonas sp. CHC150]